VFNVFGTSRCDDRAACSGATRHRTDEYCYSVAEFLSSWLK